MSCFFGQWKVEWAVRELQACYFTPNIRFDLKISTRERAKAAPVAYLLIVTDLRILEHIHGATASQVLYCHLHFGSNAATVFWPQHLA